MLDPSDSKQRNTLVDLVWLLITLYFLFAITGFQPFACRPNRPVNLPDADPPAVKDRINPFPDARRTDEK